MFQYHLQQKESLQQRKTSIVSREVKKRQCIAINHQDQVTCFVRSLEGKKELSRKLTFSLVITAFDLIMKKTIQMAVDYGILVTENENSLWGRGFPSRNFGAQQGAPR